MKIRGTDFIMFEVSNLAKAARFYREVLELPQEVYSDEYQWAEFNCGNVTLALKGGVELRATRARARLGLSVEDVHAAFAELKARGARVVGEPQDNGVCWHVEVHDPDDNVVILHHRVDGTAG